MRSGKRLLIGLAVVALLLAPSVADARFGGGASMGSRGGRTWSAPPPTRTVPGAAQQMQRSQTPNSPGYAPQSGLGAPGRGGFGSGLLGGLLGAGLVGMLFGGGLFGGIGGFGSLIGLILQIALVVWLFRFLARRFRARQPAMANGPSMFSPGTSAAPTPGYRAPPAPAVQITPADYTVFEQRLVALQAAWSAQDAAAIRGLCTPEMVGYFAEQAAELTRRGWRNQVSEVRLQQGDLSEAWNENGSDYATVAMRFSMVDVTTDAAGNVVDGSPTDHVTETEFWTFVRSPGGPWLLSAIQQTA